MSNGCSSCPPGYELLRDLQARPSVDDVQLILLSQHVDYWNRLGWVDRYSSADVTQRQRDYARGVRQRACLYATAGGQRQ